MLSLELCAGSFRIYIRRSNRPNATLNVGGSWGAMRQLTNLATGGAHSVWRGGSYT